MFVFRYLTILCVCVSVASGGGIVAIQSRLMADAREAQTLTFMFSLSRSVLTECICTIFFTNVFLSVYNTLEFNHAHSIRTREILMVAGVRL